MRTKLVRVLLFGAFTAACRTSGESPRDAALLQLSVNRQKWSTAAVHNYSFDYDFTANAFSPPVHITVQSDLVTRVTDRSSGAVYSNSGAPTVDTLFTRVDNLIRNPSTDVIVTYDGQLGFPAKIEQPSSIPDASTVTSVTNFQSSP